MGPLGMAGPCYTCRAMLCRQYIYRHARDYMIRAQFFLFLFLFLFYLWLASTENSILEIHFSNPDLYNLFQKLLVCAISNCKTYPRLPCHRSFAYLKMFLPVQKECSSVLSSHLHDDLIIFLMLTVFAID